MQKEVDRECCGPFPAAQSLCSGSSRSLESGEAKGRNHWRHGHLDPSVSKFSRWSFGQFLHMAHFLLSLWEGVVTPQMKESISEQATRPWASSFCDTWDFLWHIFFISTTKTASAPTPRHGSLETAMRWHFSSFGHGAGAKPQRHIPFLGWEIAKLLGHEFLHSAFTCGFVPPRNWCRSLVSYDFSSEHGSRYLNCTASTWELRQENWEFQASLGAKAKLCLKKLSKTFTQMNLILVLFRVVIYIHI